MFLSKYTYMFSLGEKHYLLNTYNSALIELDGNSCKKINREGSSTCNVESLSDEERDMLSSEGFLVDEEEERNRGLSVRMRYHSSKYNQGQILKIDIGITDKCNFACPYCFENGNKNTGRFNVEKNTYTELFSEIRNYILSHVNANTNNVEIVWYGGEPSLELEFICFANRVILKDAEKNGFNYSNVIITNGYTIDENIAARLKKQNVKFVQITLDGLQDMHNSRRNTVPKTDSFETILKNVECLIQNKIEIVLRINIDSTNADEIGELLDYLYGRFGGDVVGLLLFVSFGRVFGSKTSLSHMDYEAVYHNLYLKAAKLGFVTPNFEETEVGAFCGAESLNNDMVIDFKGNKYKCWNDVFALSQTVGNIYTSDFADDDQKTLTEMVYMEQLSLDNVNSGECLKCEYIKYCGGLCPYNRKLVSAGLEENIYENFTCKDIVRQRIKTHIEAYLKQQKDAEMEC